MASSSMLIGQVSDLHIRAERKLAYRTVDTAAALEACVVHLNALRPRPDVVIFTGDLGDIGDPGEYAVIREILADLVLPYRIVPGNHDDRQSLHAAFPDAAPLDADGFVQFALDGHPVRLVGLDSVDAGRPHGVLCPRRLAWLAAELAQAPERPRLLFMHHPPFRTGIRHMDVQNLLSGGAELARLVRGAPGVLGLACGHLHRPIHTLWSGIPVSCAPSPAHQVALDLDPDGPPSYILEPPGLHLHRWTPEDGLVTHLSVIGDYGRRRPFFDAEGRLIV